MYLTILLGWRLKGYYSIINITKLSSSHLSFNFSVTSFGLVLNRSFLDTMLDTTTLFSLVLIEFTSSMISLVTQFFISNARLKLSKNETRAKQYPEAKLLLFENYSLSSSKNNRIYSKKCTKKQVGLF